MSDGPRFIDDWEKRDTEGRWLKGPTITKEDLLNGTGIIERVTSEEWFKSASVSTSAGRPAGGAPAMSRKEWKPPTGKLMGFGKYKDRLMADVREDDPRYFAWCCDEIKGFREKAGDLADEP